VGYWLQTPIFKGGYYIQVKRDFSEILTCEDDDLIPFETYQDRSYIVPSGAFFMERVADMEGDYLEFCRFYYLSGDDKIVLYSSHFIRRTDDSESEASIVEIVRGDV
jgi:hypothetical protein